MVYTCPVPLERPCRACAVRGLPRLLEGAHVRLRVVRARLRSRVLCVLIFIELDEIPPTVGCNPCLEAGLAMVADMRDGNCQEGRCMALYMRIETDAPSASVSQGNSSSVITQVSYPPLEPLPPETSGHGTRWIAGGLLVENKMYSLRGETLCPDRYSSSN